ncbi:MAG: helix-turn-helix transcriptional regulator [Ruminococcaceae bacterium]|nr:helix-turn-helix transcriptional regulator [Oscillospiraceae bacterium]
MNIETANRLLQYRKRSGLSQEDLAEKIGVSRQAVSKWERAEASPDTDNLIILAKVYGVSLDDLLNVNPEEDKAPQTEDTTPESDSAPKDSVSFRGGIHVNSHTGDKVDISFREGIHVDASDGTKVHIGSGRISVDDPTGKHNYNSDTAPWINALLFIPYPIVVAAIFLFWGFSGVYGGWSTSWLTFLTIPLYYSLIDAIRKRDAHHFAFPALAALVYCSVGVFCHIWHPTWLVFLLIPVYYSICSAINKARTKNINIEEDCETE